MSFVWNESNLRLEIRNSPDLTGPKIVDSEEDLVTEVKKSEKAGLVSERREIVLRVLKGRKIKS